MSDAHQRILGTILTNLPGMLALKDKKLAYTVANPEFCQFLGKGPAEIMGKTDQELFPEAEAAACAKEDQAVLKSGMARGSELRLTGKQGARWFEVSRAAILDEKGDPAGVMFTAYDRTEFKDREAAVQSAEARVAAAEQQSTEAAQRVAAAEAAAATAQARLTELEQGSAAQKAAVEGMLQEKAALQDQLVALQQQASEAGQAAAEAGAKAESLAQQLEAAQAQIAAAQEALRQQLLAADQERDVARQQLSDLSARQAEAAQLAKQLADRLRS